MQFNIDCFLMRNTFSTNKQVAINYRAALSIGFVVLKWLRLCVHVKPLERNHPSCL